MRCVISCAGTLLWRKLPLLLARMSKKLYWFLQGIARLLREIIASTPSEWGIDPQTPSDWGMNFQTFHKYLNNSRHFNAGTERKGPLLPVEAHRFAALTALYLTSAEEETSWPLGAIWHEPAGSGLGFSPGYAYLPAAGLPGLPDVAPSAEVWQRADSRRRGLASGLGLDGSSVSALLAGRLRMLMGLRELAVSAGDLGGGGLV